MADTSSSPSTSPSTDAGPATQWDLAAQPDALAAEAFAPDRSSFTGPLPTQAPPEPAAEPVAEPVADQTPEPADDPVASPVLPVVVPGAYLFLKRWQLFVVLLAVWVPAAAVGAGLYHWWFTSFDKTWPVFAVLAFVVGCAVAALLMSLVPDRPLATAVAIAMMTAIPAAVTAAALLHGAYFFSWIDRPGIAPPG
ncbi:hypothetical protein LV457_08205 [Mycobacterium sp. MYCO198283]|uniref:hypothetical protein n=1 Tax=Mycobacterium sp. MYCO198283 TaxID=2883505 RepID=UPI001E3D8F59|nr:hypothetical protein [Mycobacterium sp. MYCO198283]MCG5432275.1 hypothetical protein [Mycobacterium sp. MYCO198283]